MNTIERRFVTLFAVAALAFAALAAACSTGDEAAAPSRTPVRPTTGEDAGGTSSSGGASSGEPGSPDAGCYDASTTPPATARQFLNQCNGGGCFPFDNAARIEGFVPGAPLPPLN